MLQRTDRGHVDRNSAWSLEGKCGPCLRHRETDLFPAQHAGVSFGHIETGLPLGSTAVPVLGLTRINLFSNSYRLRLLTNLSQRFFEAPVCGFGKRRSFDVSAEGIRQGKIELARYETILDKVNKKGVNCRLLNDSQCQIPHLYKAPNSLLNCSLHLTFFNRHVSQAITMSSGT